MNKLLFFVLVSFCLPAIAQKKLVPVSQSAITGISLPAGSRQDSRFLSEIAGKALLEMETKKTGVSIGKTELLVLPASEDPARTSDSIKQFLQAAGWSLTPADNNYFWADRNGVRVIAYFSGTKKENSLYFGEASGQGAPPPQPPTDPQQQGQPQQPASNIPDPQQQIGQQQDNNQGPQNNMPAASGSSGIILFNTNFDDGWSATPQTDWIQVVKNGLTVRLHYSIELPDQYRSNSGNEIVDYFWNRLAASRFTTSTLEKRPVNSYEYYRIYYLEATGTENSSGQQLFIAFRIIVENGIADCVEITAPSKDAFLTEFPDQDKIAGMRNYNRFAVSPDDITGLWKESTGGFAQYYNVYNGNYAGMNATSISSQFQLSADGTCKLEHKGASGMVGNQQFFSESYSGRFSMTNWDLGFTDQNGKTHAFHAMYKAIRNGRILYLQNKQYKGQEYFFVKTE